MELTGQLSSGIILLQRDLDIIVSMLGVGAYILSMQGVQHLITSSQGECRECFMHHFFMHARMVVMVITAYACACSTKQLH